MMENGYDYLIGCASISMGDGGHTAASLYNQLKDSHLAPLEYHMFPRCPLPLDNLRQDLAAETPPLIKGYLRLGAMVGNGAVVDQAFNTTDVLIILPISSISGRYVNYYGADAGRFASAS